MAYVIPQMPLLCAIWSQGDTPGVDPPREFDVPCNLGWGRRVLNAALTYPSTGVCVHAQLLLLAGTDIRGYLNSGTYDQVEVPQGSGRFYYVSQVDDIGKGFPNEHRFALISTSGNWPEPYP